MKKSIKWLLIIVAVLLIAWFAFSAYNKGKDSGEKVTVETVAKRVIVETVTASGNVYPEVEVKISPDISGQITNLMVQEGDSVKKGQVLARIYADIYALQKDQAAAQVAQARATVANSEAALLALQATLKNAEDNYKRNKTLFDQKVISQAELEQIETTYQSAQANYNAAKQNIRSLEAGTNVSQSGLSRANKDLSRTTIVAPMDGVVSSLSIKEGESVAGNSFNVGTEMMRVADMNIIEVRVDVGENDIVKVNLGDSADVEVDAYNNRKFKGVVTQIASSTKSNSLTGATTTDVTNYEVRIRLDKASYSDLIDPAKPRRFPFRPGMNASADIKTKRKDNVLSVPIAAVNARLKGSDKSLADSKKEKATTTGTDEDQNTSATAGDEMEEVVYVLQADNTVKKILVKSGIQDMNYIEILSGLTGNEKVVSGPYSAISQTLKDGTKVKVVTKEELFKK